MHIQLEVSPGILDAHVGVGVVAVVVVVGVVDVVVIVVVVVLDAHARLSSMETIVETYT